MKPSRNRYESAPPGLFDPERHEPPTSAQWDPTIVRASIRDIVVDAATAFDRDGLWPAHPLDEPITPETRYSMLYLGAGGVIWGLKRLARIGYAEVDPRFDAVIPDLVARNRTVGETAQGGTASYLMGDAGLLLLHWMTTRSAEIADRLFEVVHGNLHHPAREML